MAHGPTQTPPRADGPVAHFGTSVRDVVVCRVCGRSLLMGERSTGFFTRAGEGPFDVCELCVPRAKSFGLRSRPSTPDEVSKSQRPRRGAQLLARLRRPITHPDKPVVRAVPANASVGTAAIPVALATFNASRHSRTLAGLHKTLGAPRASVVPRSPTDREVILTVAWEIVWYQFRILPEGDVEDTRGTYISELPSRWRIWNCTITPAGTALAPVLETEVEGI